MISNQSSNNLSFTGRVGSFSPQDSPRLAITRNAGIATLLPRITLPERRKKLRLGVIGDHARRCGFQGQGRHEQRKSLQPASLLIHWGSLLVSMSQSAPKPEVPQGHEAITQWP